MPKIEIQQGDHKTGAMSGYGVKVFADGVELKELRGVEVYAHVDAVVQVRVEQLVTDGWSFKHDNTMLVLQPILVPNGTKLQFRQLEDGTSEYRAVVMTEEEAKAQEGWR